MSNTVTLTFAGDSSRLEKAFDRVGTAAKKMDKDVGKVSASFDKVGKAAADAGDKVSKGFMSRFGDKMTSMLPGAVGEALGKLPTAVQGPAGVAALAIVAAMGPLLGAGIASAVLLGLGGGVLALGIKQALKDPKVEEAWTGLKERAGKSLSGFTDAFKGPVTRAMKTFGDAMERMEPTFTRIGQTMAPIIDKLAPALVDMAEKAMPGIEKAIKESGPLFDKLAEHLPEIGEAMSSFFDSISDSGPGAVSFFSLILTILEKLFRFWGNGIEFWSNVMEVLDTFFTEKIPKAWGKLVDLVKEGVDWFSDIPEKMKKLFGKVADYITKPFRSAFNAVARAWNNTIGQLSWTVPNWVPLVGGNSISAPKLPTFHSGISAVPGRPGENVLAVLQAGERVSSPSASRSGVGSGMILEVHSGGSRLDDLLVEIIARAVRVRGGNVQLVLGGARG